MGESVFARLASHNRPVDRAAVVVGFFGGEHFEARFDFVRPKGRTTFGNLPRMPERPASAADYAGFRRGRMTACGWFRPSKSEGATLWICRCDCGAYELRRPGTWSSKPYPGDMCEICQRSEEMLRGPSSRSRTLDRLATWIDRMRAVGLTDEEIIQLRAPGVNIDTKGRGVSEIRASLAAGKGVNHE